MNLVQFVKMAKLKLMEVALLVHLENAKSLNFFFFELKIFKNQNYLSGKPKFEHLNPFRNFSTSYPIQDVQSTYYYNENFEEAIKMILKFGKNLRKPMKCYYDSITKTVKIIINKEIINLFFFDIIGQS